MGSLVVSQRVRSQEHGNMRVLLQPAEEGGTKPSETGAKLAPPAAINPYSETQDKK
jgi:hypothetical protein